MKTLSYIFVIGFILSLTAACNKKLDVDPQNQITYAELQTSANVEALLFGAYTGLQGPTAFGESFIFGPDLVASDSQLIFRGSFQDYQAAFNQTMVSTNLIALNLWGGSYNIIGICNTVLDKLSLVDSADQATIKGEALFIRGTCYFELAGLFCKPYSDGNASTNPGAPVVLSPTYSYATIAKPGRGTVAQTYAQAVSDLTAAIALLPTSQMDYRATSYSAMAMLSRVYLNMGDYTDAAIQANNVISSGNFILNSTFDKAFNNSGASSEDIFTIQQTSQSNAGTTNNGLTTFYCPYPAGRGDAILDSNYLNFFEPNDFRGTFFTAGGGQTFSGTAGFTTKWLQFFKTIPVVRLSEMYLTRGESNLITGANLGTDPLTDINTVRARAGASNLTTVSQQDFVNERFRELAYEGDRYWTLKRVKQNVNGFGFDDVHVIYPIPQADLDVNPNLVQNK